MTERYVTFQINFEPSNTKMNLETKNFVGWVINPAYRVALLG
jgi:hypothetical protein